MMLSVLYRSGIHVQTYVERERQIGRETDGSMGGNDSCSAETSFLGRAKKHRVVACFMHSLQASAPCTYTAVKRDLLCPYVLEYQVRGYA